MAIKFFSIVILIISYVYSIDIKGDVDFDREIDYTSLPNESPTLIGLGILNNKPDLRKKVYDYVNIIGSLPLHEQNYILKKMIDVNYSDQLKKFYDKEMVTLINYLEDFEKQMPYGLGCFEYVANKYAYKSDYNKDMRSIVYKEIDNMIKAQREGIQSKLNLIKNVQPQLVANRNSIYQIANKINENDFLKVKDKYNMSKNIFTEVLFNSTQKEDIVGFFRKYFEEQKNVTTRLSRAAIKAEIALSNMDGCRDYSDNDMPSGTSSTYRQFPKITYRNGRKPIAINENKEIGIDNRTSNGYKLYQGFFNGKSLRHNSSGTINSYLPRTLQKRFEEIEGNVKKNSSVETIYNLIKDSIQKGDIFEDLVNYTLSFDKKFGDKCKSELPPEKLNDSWWYICDKRNEYPVGLFQDENNKTELIFSNETLSNVLSFVNQGCIGVFTSGGKKDKDACRDVIKDKCGNELDYQCKKLGLYDYLNSNPSAYEIPPICQNESSFFNNSQCFELINQNFFKGGVILKPSALTGTNLILQNLNLKPQTFELKTNRSNDKSSDSYQILGNQNLTDLLGCYINQTDENEKVFCQNSNIFRVYSNKAHNFILQNSSNNLRMQIWNMFLIVAIFILV